MHSAARYDVLFATDRFNLSQPRDYFINDCCYGDDAAQWLVERLRARGLSATEPGQEDWGWYFDARHGDSSYFVGVGGNADEEPARSNRGEWRLIVEKHRTLWQKLTGANLMREDDAFLGILKETLASEPGFRLIGVE
jgi:hypothetical protein